MKKIIILLLLPVLTVCCDMKQQKSQETEVATTVDRLMKGIVNADENVLKSIAADDLVYGHSNGKVQNKSEFIAEILSGQPLVYVSIELSDQTIQISGDIAIVRHIFTAETKSAEGEPGNLKIGVMQIWQQQSGAWKLLARQAYKI